MSDPEASGVHQSEGKAEEGTPLLAEGARVQSLWVQPVLRERVQGVPVAVEGFYRWSVLGSSVGGLLP